MNSINEVSLSASDQTNRTLLSAFSRQTCAGLRVGFVFIGSALNSAEALEVDWKLVNESMV